MPKICAANDSPYSTPNLKKKVSWFVGGNSMQIFPSTMEIYSGVAVSGVYDWRSVCDIIMTAFSSSVFKLFWNLKAYPAIRQKTLAT